MADDAEKAFAKAFLAVLDSKPARIAQDHVEDPRLSPAPPPYILPRMPRPMTKATVVAPGQARGVVVQLKSLRNPSIDIKLPSQPLTTSILEIKNALGDRIKAAPETIKLLHRKRPVADSKALKDIVADGEHEVELSVMVIGTVGWHATTVAADTGAAAQLQTTTFWDDLRGFLLQRLKDEQKANELTDICREAVRRNESS